MLKTIQEGGDRGGYTSRGEASGGGPRQYRRAEIDEAIRVEGRPKGFSGFQSDVSPLRARAHSMYSSCSLQINVTLQGTFPARWRLCPRTRRLSRTMRAYLKASKCWPNHSVTSDARYSQLEF